MLFRCAIKINIINGKIEAKCRLLVLNFCFSASKSCALLRLLWIIDGTRERLQSNLHVERPTNVSKLKSHNVLIWASSVYDIGPGGCRTQLTAVTCTKCPSKWTNEDVKQSTEHVEEEACLSYHRSETTWRSWRGRDRPKHDVCRRLVSACGTSEAAADQYLSTVERLAWLGSEENC